MYYYNLTYIPTSGGNVGCNGSESFVICPDCGKMTNINRMAGMARKCGHNPEPAHLAPMGATVHDAKGKGESYVVEIKTHQELVASGYCNKFPWER